MEDLDSKIDVMSRKKLVSLLQENSVRVGKINIRYTKNNNKNSLERMNALYSSYERLLKEALKHTLNIEKKVRKKYVESLTNERKEQIISSLTTEVELIGVDMVRELKTDFALVGSGEEFEARVEKSMLDSKQKVEVQMQNLMETLNEEVRTSGALPPAEIQRLYSIDESALIDLGVLEPLQKIHIFFGRLSDDARYKTAFDGILGSVSLAAKLGDSVASAPESLEARKQQKMDLIRGSLVLKDLIHNINLLCEQMKLPPENRNMEVMGKVWKQVEELFHERKGWEEVFSGLKPFHDLLQIG